MMQWKSDRMTVLCGLGLLILGVGAWLGVTMARSARTDKPAAPIAASQPVDRQPDFDAEFRQATEAAGELQTNDSAKMKRIIRERLAAGYAVGQRSQWRRDLSAYLMRWASHLSPAARDEYARRCLEACRQTRNGQLARPQGWNPQILEPLDLYATAANLAVTPDLRGEATVAFYNSADAYNARIQRRHTDQVNQYNVLYTETPDPPPIPASIGQKYALSKRSLLGNGPPDQLPPAVLYDWRFLDRRPIPIIRDPR